MCATFVVVVRKLKTLKNSTDVVLFQKIQELFLYNT
jgi:hypothetical protein